MFYAIKMQILLMINKFSFKLAFTIIMLYNIVSYLSDSVKYIGSDIINIYSASFIFSGNDYAPYWNIFEALFPFLVVFPFAFSYLDDLYSGIIAYQLSRFDVFKYYTSKLIAGFIGGFFIILIPFFVNIILCYLTFRENYHTPWGPYNLVSYFEELSGSNVYINTDFVGQPLLRVYLFSPFLNNALYILILSFFSGVLSMFSVACSFFLTKHKMILFLPVYTVFLLGTIIDLVFRANMDKVPYINFRWMTYSSFNSSAGRYYLVFTVLVMILILFCASAVWRSTRKDIF